MLKELVKILTVCLIGAIAVQGVAMHVLGITVKGPYWGVIVFNILQMALGGVIWRMTMVSKNSGKISAMKSGRKAGECLCGDKANPAL